MFIAIKKFFFKLRLSAARSGRRGPLLPVDIESWCAFYARDELNETNTPLAGFCQQTLQHSVPDVGNPWPQGTEEHYHIHPGGFICDEFYGYAQGAQRDDLPEDVARREARKACASDRINFLTAFGASFVSVQAQLSGEQFEYLLQSALLSSQQYIADLDPIEACNQSIKAGILSHPFPLFALMSAQKLVESYQNGALMDVPMPPPPPTAPPVDLSAWRVQNGRV